MLSPFGICRQAFVSALRFVRQVFKHFERVVGTELKHFDSFVRHFVAHFMPVDPAKHAAYAVWNALEQRLGAPWQSCSCRAFLTHSRVAGLNGCGWSVVEVVEVVVDVVVLLAFAVVVVTCACTVPRRSTIQVRNPTLTVFDGRNMSGLPQNFAMASSWRRVWVGLFTKFEVPWLATHGWLMKFVKYARALRVSGFSS
jgi:hypothetical protein